MEEITGPILAITLVLSSVFIPCCFLGGVTGQFFRQFAVTIAVSTIISAINAITMTPSRAVVIFKTEEGADGHEHKQGSAALVVLRHHRRRADRLAGRKIPGRTAAACHRACPAKQCAAVDAAGPSMRVYFIPGAIVGGVIGWFIIEPVNAVLGVVLPRLQSPVRSDDRRRMAATVGGLLRISAIVLFVYGGLLVLTYLQFVRTPTGFIPQQDKGYLLLNVQLPDSASVERTQRMMGRIEDDRQDRPTAWRTPSALPASR